MTDVTADAMTLMRQAHMTAGEYLDHGVRDIDGAFGQGYARAHPELLAAYMRTAATDLMTAILAKEIGGAIEAVAEAMAGARDDAIILALRQRNGGTHEPIDG